MPSRLEHRTERILKLLLQRGTVTVDELTTALEASGPSIRRDLVRLESKGLIKRNHGGASLVQELLYEPFRYDTAFQSREQRFVRQKRHIGIAAAELVQPNEIVGFTAGTTTTWVARSLRHREGIIVYVHWPWSFSLVGPAAIDVLRDTFMDKIFLSVSGVDAVRGTTTNESDEALTFRAMVKQAKQVIVVADSSKLGVVTPSLICPIEDVHVIVTDTGASENDVTRFKSRGIQVIRT